MRKLLFIFLLLSQQSFGGNILTINGYVPDYEIKLGDRVVTIDLKTGDRKVNTVMEVRVMDTKWYSLQNEDYTYYVINRIYTFFSGQSIYDGGRVVHVSEIEVGDTLYDQYGQNIIVNEIGVAHPNHKWFRFIISGNHSYIEDGIVVHNASRFWVGGGSSANWSATSNTNWSATSGGSNNATVPGATDDVTFDGVGASGNTSSTVSANITVLSLSFTTGYTQTVTINTTVTLTIAGNFTDRTQHSWTVSGTGQMTISAASTITSNGKTFPGPVNFTGANTKTLSGDWTISGALICASGTVTINKTTAEVLSCAGFTVNTTTTGTINITLTGGTWSGASACTVSGTITFAGNVTFSQTGGYNSGTLKYTSGTITTAGSTLTCSAATTFDTNGMSWNNVSLSGNVTFTINSLLTVTGTLTIGNNIMSILGTAGFTAATLQFNATSNNTITLKNSITYTVTTSLIANRTGSTTLLPITSNDGTLKAILTLNNGATCNVAASFTRIDASAGRTIWTFNGTVTSCNNINTFNDLKTVSKSFVQ